VILSLPAIVSFHALSKHALQEAREYTQLSATPFSYEHISSLDDVGTEVGVSVVGGFCGSGIQFNGSQANWNFSIV
jgi:hypothetical protein